MPMEVQPPTHYVCFNHEKLGSILSEDCDVNHNQIKQTFATFGNLRRKVFQNKHLQLHTKVTIIKAICSRKFDSPNQL